MVERGPSPGTKTVMGGAVWLAELRKIMPDFPKGAPVERPVSRLGWHLAGSESSIILEFDSRSMALQPDRYVVSRHKFDPWLAGQAVRAGAELLTSALADDVTWDGDRVTGVRLFPSLDLVSAPVTIICEGIWPHLGIRAGLVRETQAASYSLFVKEMRAMAPSEIERRFGLTEGQGAVLGFVGSPTGRLMGTTSIFTYHDSVALAVGVVLDQLALSGITPKSVLAQALSYPTIARFLEGTKVISHQARLVANGGYFAIPGLSGNGVLLAGAASQMEVGRQGHRDAMRAGRIAAETAIEAARAGDYSARFLKNYRTKIMNSTLGQDLRITRKAAGLYAAHPDLFSVYPEMLNDMAKISILDDGSPIRQKRKKMLVHALRMRPVPAVLADTLAALWATM